MNLSTPTSRPPLTAIGILGIVVGLLIMGAAVLALFRATDPHAAGGIGWLLFGGAAFIYLGFAGCRRA